MVATKEDAEAALGTRAREFAGHVIAALNEFVQEFGEKRDKLSKASEAFIISDLIRRRLATAYPVDATGGPRSFKRGNRFLVIDQNFNIKAKKLNARLLASNVSTAAVRSFQSHQMMLPDFPEVTSLHLGYQLVSEVELASARIFLTCPSGAKSNRWAWELTGAEEVKAPPPAEVSGLGKTKRVRIRDGAKGGEKSGGKSGTGGANGAAGS